MVCSGVFVTCKPLTKMTTSASEQLLHSIGIDTRAVVASRLLLRTLKTIEDGAIVAAPDAEEINAQTLRAFETTFGDFDYVRQHAPNDFRQTDSPSVARLRTTQELWCGIVTDSILMAAGYRGGDLSAVPFLEPKSISHEHQIQYPFKQRD